MIRERYCKDGENEQKAEDECVGDFPLHASFLHHATASVELVRGKTLTSLDICFCFY